MKKLASLIWNISEKYNIPLGKYAPKIFGLMIGYKPRKVLTKKDIIR